MMLTQTQLSSMSELLSMLDGHNVYDDAGENVVILSAEFSMDDTNYSITRTDDGMGPLVVELESEHG